MGPDRKGRCGKTGRRQGRGDDHDDEDGYTAGQLPDRPLRGRPDEPAIQTIAAGDVHGPSCGDRSVSQQSDPWRTAWTLSRIVTDRGCCLSSPDYAPKQDLGSRSQLVTSCFCHRGATTRKPLSRHLVHVVHGTMNKTTHEASGPP